MIDIAKATEILDNYFANVTDEQFATDLERFCPEIDTVTTQSLVATSAKLHLRSLADLPGELVRIREDVGITRQALGAKLGMSAQEVQKHEEESYRSVSFAQLLQVAKVLGITSSQVVMEIDRLQSQESSTRIFAGGADWWENWRAAKALAIKWSGVSVTSGQLAALKSENKFCLDRSVQYQREPIDISHRLTLRFKDFRRDFPKNA
jgi:transcriptional regulator with XRE-family HTH domain